MTLFRSLAPVLAIVALAVLAAPAAQAGARPDVAAALDRWKAAIEKGDIKAIMSQYDRDARFISTFAQKPLTRRSDIEAYFKKVVVNPGIKVEIEDSQPRTYGTIAVNSGRYDLSYEQEGETVSTPARFTFVYRLEGDQWKIIEQHSSRVPLPDEDKK
jgi:uncharacterized protein (TIGR02246 family)